MQSLFICAKYSIHDNFITSNTITYNCIGITFAAIFCILVFYQLVISIHNWKKISLGWCNVYDFFFFSVGLIINYFSNITTCNNNILLILKIQHVQRVLKIDGIYLKNLVASNWAYVIVLNFIYVMEMVFFWMCFSLDNILDILGNYFSISFDINIVYATFFINLMRKTLGVWIKDMQLLRFDEDSDSHWNIMFDLYLNILKAYKIFEKTFRLLVSI